MGFTGFEEMTVCYLPCTIEPSSVEETDKRTSEVDILCRRSLVLIWYRHYKRQFMKRLTLERLQMLVHPSITHEETGTP